MKIPIEVSARHIHLSLKDLKILFGKNYKLTKKRNLTQPGQFSAQETVTIRFKNKEISKLRIVGPTRSQTQVELSLTDAFNLGIKIPIRKSGNLKGSPGILLIGPFGKLNIKEGVICPWRHIHISPKEANRLKIKEDDFVSVKTGGIRSAVLHKVQVRVSKNYKLCFHLDTDEGNASGIFKKGAGILLGF